MEQMIDLLVNSGVAVAVIAYFCIRDWRFTDQISRTLSAIETLLKHEESEEDKKFTFVRPKTEFQRFSAEPTI